MTETQNQAAPSALNETAAVRLRRSRFERIRILLSRAPLTAWFGMIVVSFYAIAAVFAPLIAPYGEAEIFAKADDMK